MQGALHFPNTSPAMVHKQAVSIIIWHSFQEGAPYPTHGELVGQVGADWESLSRHHVEHKNAWFIYRQFLNRWNILNYINMLVGFLRKLQITFQSRCGYKFFFSKLVSPPHLFQHRAIYLRSLHRKIQFLRGLPTNTSMQNIYMYDILKLQDKNLPFQKRNP